MLVSCKRAKEQLQLNGSLKHATGITDFCRHHPAIGYSSIVIRLVSVVLINAYFFSVPVVL